MLVNAETGEEAAWALVRYPHGVLDTRLPGGTPLEKDWALQDPRDYLAVIAEGIPKVLRDSGVQADAVVGIGADFTTCTMLPTLADGTPLCTLPEFASNPHAWVKLWKHHAAQPEAERINRIGAERNEEALRIYSGKYSSEWFFSKVLQILDEAPEIYHAAGRLLEAADWITWQLTGQERRNECTAGYKGMWIKGKGFPSREFFRTLDPRLENVVAEKLAERFDAPGTRAGGLTAEMARVTGLAEGTPVAVGVGDAHAAVPACGVVRPGSLCMIMGTSLCHMLLADQRSTVEGVCGVVEDGIVPGYWGYEAGQAAVGDIFAWWFRTSGQSPGTLTEGALRLRPGESGLLALDWWNGNRSVLMDADLSGVLVGATLATRPEEIYRALVEATAFGTYTVIRAFESQGIAIRDLVACGGLAESPLVMQIFADVTNRTIRLPRSVQASGLGAAMHAAVAAGVYPDFARAAERMVGAESRRFPPDPAAHAVYEQLYAEYLQLHDYFGRGANPVLQRIKALGRAASRSAVPAI